jgi:hypothetical protein
VAGGAYLVICLSFGLSTGIIGRAKGSSFWIWFLVGAILPGIGLLAVLLSRIERDELRRECPGCGKVVKLYDQVCTRCGEDMDFPDVAIAPESTSVGSGRR